MNVTVFRNLFPFTDQLKFETKFRRRDRSVIDVRGMVRILHSGQTKYWVLVMRDVTKEKRKELDLLRFSNVIHNTINPIQISDANGTMVYVNPAFEKVTGYSNTELIGKNPNILNSRKHSKEFWSGVWKHIISGKVWIGRIENRRKDGSPFFTELVISPIVDSHGKIAGYLGAHRDITEQIILEQQLVRSQRMESIGTLAAGIAHEVGNPLTAISSLVQVLQRTSVDEIAVSGLPTSCAIPAARVPILSIFYERTSCCSKIICSVISRCRQDNPRFCHANGRIGEMTSSVKNQTAVFPPVFNSTYPNFARNNMLPYSRPKFFAMLPLFKILGFFALDSPIAITGHYFKSRVNKHHCSICIADLYRINCIVDDIGETK